MATKYHAEHVGSLLRPRWLLEARAAHKQGTLDREALREAEDRAALQAIDTERAGGFAPLRFVRPGTTVVLGLVSSKLPQPESPDELRRRIDEAARYVPIADLALSPQCGFASTSGGNQLTMDEERRKLELVASTASKVWD